MTSAPDIHIYPMGIQYKDLEQHDQFNDPEIVDPRLYGLVQSLAVFCWRMFHKDIWITDVDRPAGRKASPHRRSDKNTFVRAVDIRAHFGYWTDIELRTIKSWLRRYYPRTDMRVCERTIQNWYGPLRHHGHELGQAHEHLHITVEPIDQMHGFIIAHDGESGPDPQ